MTLPPRLAAIRTRLAKATPGPWQLAETPESSGRERWFVKDSQGHYLFGLDLGTRPQYAFEHEPGEKADQSAIAHHAIELAAHAPTDLAYALRVLAVAQEIAIAAEFVADWLSSFGAPNATTKDEQREALTKLETALTHWTQVTQEGTG